MKTRHWKTNNWEVAVHQEKKNPLGKVEVGVIGSARELRRKKTQSRTDVFLGLSVKDEVGCQSRNEASSL